MGRGWQTRSISISAALTGRPRGGKPIEMPTPIEVLATIESTLATEGYIKGFDPPSNRIDPFDMTFKVILNSGTELIRHPKESRAAG